MKLGKLSLVAVMALGTSAFAIDNVKVSGEAKLIYQTADFEKFSTDPVTAKTGLFEQGELGTANQLTGASYGGASAGGASLSVGMTADLTKEVSAGAEMQAFSTLGLENNLVSSTMVGGSGADSWAMSQLWLASTMGKTTVKVGRMELDTPLAFTEKWNIIKNTFDAAVVLNSDLPDTTLVGAWVGKHNGVNMPTQNFGATGRTAQLDNGAEGTTGYDTFVTDGAYAVGAINSSVPGVTLQAWYYDLVQYADAFWLQADAKIMDMITVGAQYSSIDPKSAMSAVPESSIWAIKAGADVAGVNVYAAYSQADKDGIVGFSNVATGDKTKIYTGDGSIYMDGIVTAPGAKAYKIGASTKMVPGVTLAASYASASDIYDIGGNDIAAWDVSASTKAGPVGLTAIYTQVDNDTVSGGSAVKPAMYADAAGNSRDNDTLRIIASLKF